VWGDFSPNNFSRRDSVIDNIWLLNIKLEVELTPHAEGTEGDSVIIEACILFI